MNTVVCYKWVKDEEDIRVTPDGHVDYSKAQSKLSDYDRNAIEACCQIADATASRPVGVTFGGDDIGKAHSNALARGLEESFGVAGGEVATTADAFVTANVLAALIRKAGEFNAVICGEGSSDSYAHQVGPRLGYLLGLPVVTEVSAFEINGGTARLTRQLGARVETVEVALPALIVVLPEACGAPIPGLKAVLAAKKKPSTTFELAELGLDDEELAPKAQVVRSGAFEMQRKNVVFKEGDSADKVLQLIEALKGEGVM